MLDLKRLDRKKNLTEKAGDINFYMRRQINVLLEAIHCHALSDEHIDQPVEVILSAWGCGAEQHEPLDVAQCFREAFYRFPEDAYRVTFAISNNNTSGSHKHNYNFEVFHMVFDAMSSAKNKRKHDAKDDVAHGDDQVARRCTQKSN